VRTTTDGSQVAVSVESECDAIQRLGEELTYVSPWQEITFRGEGPLTLKMGTKYCYHPACPVPVGIIKAIEVEAGLALPKDVVIKVAKSED
jgi:hypothetical protein